MPNTLFTTAAKASESQIGKALISNGFNSDLFPHYQHFMLAAYTALEYMNMQSHAKAYYDSFPENFEEYAQLWPETDLEILKGSSFLWELTNEKMVFAHEYDHLAKIAPWFAEKVSITRYVYSRLAVMSRSFTITNAHGEKEIIMVPVMDMFNHSSNKNVEWGYNDEKKTFCLTTIADIKMGETINSSYGMRPNSDFFMHYGFLDTTNERKKIAALLNLEANDPNYQVKADLCDGNKFLHVELTEDFLAKTRALEWMRYVAFDGDMTRLVELKAMMVEKQGPTE